MITKVSSDEYVVAFEIKKDDVWKVPSTLEKEANQNNNNTCSKRFNSDYVVVHPSVLLNLQKSMSHMLTIFSTILRSLIQKTASTVLIKCKKMLLT